MLVLKRKMYFKKKEEGETPFWFNTSRTETRPKFCHSVTVAGIERIEIQYFLRRKTKHLYKWLVFVFSLRVRFQARALHFCCSMTLLVGGPPRDNDSVVGPRIFLISGGKVYQPALFWLLIEVGQGHRHTGSRGAAQKPEGSGLRHSMGTSCTGNSPVLLNGAQNSKQT